jgi:hypothetical protein
LIFSKIREDIPNEKCTNGVIDTGGISIDRCDTDGILPTVSMTPAARPVSTTLPAVNLPLVPVVNIDNTVKSSTPYIEHFVDKIDLKTATQLVSDQI